MSFEIDNEIQSAAWNLEEIVPHIPDIEIRKMMIDLSKMLLHIYHDNDQYKEGEEYKPAIREFKEKWFTSSRADRLKEIIDQRLSEVKEELLKTIGESK